jgi:ferric-dicitrate binding protein FerR (iron transport regulator)
VKVTALIVSGALAAWFAGSGAASAQQPGFGCRVDIATLGRPQTIRCGGGLTIVAEDGATFTLLDRDHDGKVDGVDLQGKAVFVTAPKKKTGRQFEVLTPQAIAAVRGTQWAVDAEGAKTSVFVDTGRVAVRRPTVPGQVVLGPGDGVDVDESATPLEVKRWPAPRVAALMARLGR